MTAEQSQRLEHLRSLAMRSMTVACSEATKRELWTRYAEAAAEFGRDAEFAMAHGAGSGHF